VGQGTGRNGVVKLRDMLRLRSRSKRDAKLIAAIQRTGLFDADYYLANNPDVAATGVNPVLHFAQRGWKEGRRPGPRFDSVLYLEQNPDVARAGVNPLLHYAKRGRAEGRRGPLEGGTSSALIRTYSGAWAPLPVFADPRAPPTVTVLTDTIAPQSVFGGVGTAMVVGALAARRIGARLRLATRHDAPDPAAFGQVLKANRISWDGATEFVHIPLSGDRPLALGDGDVVLTTSWWTTRSALGSVDASRILYLLQEDERMFYPFGDDRLRCAETLSEPGLRILINTKMLFDHLVGGPDALPGLRERSDWFAPAFPAIPEPDKEEAPRVAKGNFFFYARPNNPRNLYWRGLEVIDGAMRAGILAPEEWNFHFVGAKLPAIELPGGVRPIVSAVLPWSDYAKLVSKMDLGLCLMDTPHPSYPPLDLAAAGAVVVTNTHGSKESLEHWSRNIIAAPPIVSALVEALRRGAALSRDVEQRAANFAANNISRDWEASLLSVLERVFPNKVS
jgi:hypothetical protein